MIKNIIFDMGNVLIKFDRDAFLDKVGVTGEDRALLLREVYLSPQWFMMDRGIYTEAQAAAEICKNVPERLHGTVHDLVDRWDRPILPIDGMAELVRELKEKGYGIFLLSNASYRQHEYWPEIPGAEYFEDTLISADVKVVKPMPEIYLLALSQFGIKGVESVFIDDSPVNIEAAIYCGINGITFFGDTDVLRTKLRALGVEV